MPSFMSSAVRLHTAEIVGGQLAPSPIPWQAAIQQGNSFICGATILDAFSVLSAAHCFHKKNFSGGLSIRAGSIEKSNGGQVRFLIYNYKLILFLSRFIKTVFTIQLVKLTFLTM